MPSFLAIALLSGIACVGLHVSAMSGLAGAGILSLFSPVPLYYAAFAAGPLAGVVSAGVAAFGVALLQGEVAAVVFLAIWGLPAALVGGMAVRMGKEETGRGPGLRLSRALEVLSACGVFLVMLGVAFLGGMTGWSNPAQKIASLLDAQVLEASTQMSLPPEAVSEMFHKLSEILPGLGGVVWLLLMFVSVVVAQRLVWKRKEEAEWNSGMAGLRLSRWVLPGFVACSFAGIFGRGIFGFAGTNLACILLVPFFVDGLAVAHAVAFRRGRRARVWVWFLYGSLLMFNVLAIPVAGLGMMDQWSNLRLKLVEKLPGRENE
ncbi:MAG TPA: hypothetical protein DCW68_02300 [Rhodospirillaceae bacterium]|nr:MAG: hypothetical protein A2018_05270 [Alphaproteobacteria bacterium GWF2_58_20]HAU28925.1 hypothetical protein [Rhodospirillaceae bacterium]